MRTTLFCMFALVVALNVAPSGAVAGGSGISAHWQHAAWLKPGEPGMARGLVPSALPPRRRAGLRRLTTTAWSVIPLGTPAGLQSGIPFAINQRGDITLQFCSSAFCTEGTSAPATGYPYLWDARAMREIPLARFGTFQAEQYYPEGLNSSGTIVGCANLFDGKQWFERPVVWQRVGATGSTISYLDARPGYSGCAYAVNDKNVIVGADGTPAVSAAPLPVRFTSTGPVLLAPLAVSDGGAALTVNASGLAAGNNFGEAIIFNSPAGTAIPGLFLGDSTAISIDSAGNVAGNDPNGSTEDPEAYLYLAASKTSKPLRFGTGTNVYGMNSYDEIVGYVDEEVGDSRDGAFLSRGGAFPTLLADLAPDGVGLGLALAINDHQQIVGIANGPTLMQPTGLARCRKLATPVSCQ